MCNKREEIRRKIIKIKFDKSNNISYLCLTNNQKNMSKFDRNQIKQIHKDINDALAIVARKHGMLSLTTATLRFDETRFKVTVNGIASLDAFTQVTPVLSIGDTINPNSLIGRVFISGNGTKFTVSDYKSNRPKYPIVAKNASGTQYKFTVDAVKRGLVK